MRLNITGEIDTGITFINSISSDNFMLLSQLKSEYATCTRCPELIACRTQVVFGSGNPHAKIVIIGEAPGATEDEKGIPFIGRSGQLLTELLTSIGLSRDDIFITNTILCRPPENRNPKPNELHNCRSRLDQTIALIDPKVIITLGNFATKYVLNTKEGITTLRGKPQNKDGRTILPMYHPAVLIYNGNQGLKREEMEKDFQTLKGLLA